MKKILITGANSYIGTSLEKWLGQYPEGYKVDTVDMVDGTWREKDFSGYDVVFHVAGIAHVKETKENHDFYYKVNRDLAFKTAKKAKLNGVKQFIFLSSMSVYGMETGVIDRNTPVNPNNAYGKSKKEAEELITPLGDNYFKIAVLRPPMVYGPGCKGNYNLLVKFAHKLPMFPNIKNKRSMISINKFCEFIVMLIENYDSGLFFPQNEEYICTSEMVKEIAKSNGRKMYLSKMLNPFVWIAMMIPGRIGSFANKAFGNLIYDVDMK